MTPKQKARYACGIAALIVGVALANAQPGSPLRLEKTIPLPGATGRLDHMAFDAEHQRLFVAVLGNNTVDVVDIKNGTLVRTISGLAEPQGIVYQPEKQRLWIANGKMA